MNAKPKQKKANVVDNNVPANLQENNENETIENVDLGDVEAIANDVQENALDNATANLDVEAPTITPIQNQPPPPPSKFHLLTISPNTFPNHIINILNRLILATLAEYWDTFHLVTSLNIL